MRFVRLPVEIQPLVKMASRLVDSRSGLFVLQLPEGAREMLH